MNLQRAPSIFVLLFLLLFSLVSCVEIQIQRDEIPPTDTPGEGTYFSYSGVIEFTGDVNPENTCQLSDGEFAQLCKMAHDKMVEVSSRRTRASTMAALQYGRKIYFASSVKSQWGDQYFASAYNEMEVQGSVGEYINTCLLQAGGEGGASAPGGPEGSEGADDNDNNGDPTIDHRVNGRCAEPNVIRLFHQNEGIGYQNPVPNRFAVWRTTGANRGQIEPPCSKGDTKGPKAGKSGCAETFATRFELNPISKDTALEDVNLDNLGIRVAENQRPSFEQ